MRTTRIFFAALMMFAFSAATLGGPAGCGGAGSNKKSGQAGLTVFSISSIPTFRHFFNPAILVENGPTPILKLQTAPGTFCSEFCYLKQGLLEAQRQIKTIDYSVCLAKAVQGSDAAFDIPANGCLYVNLVTGSGGVPVRLCRDGDQVSASTCSGGAADAEYVFTNNPSAKSVSAVLTRRFQNADGCEDKSQLDFSGNCPPDQFLNGDCRVAINGSFCGCYGSGQVNYGVTGGDSPQIDVHSNFAAGGIGAATSGAFNFCSIGNWALGNTGCFKSNADGSFPSIPASEVPVSQIEGCAGLTSATELCPNEKFDPNAFDPAYPVCPFKPGTGGSCAFLFDNTGCCDVSGDSLEAESATASDPSGASSIFDQVSSASCPGTVACDSLAFVNEWDCKPPAGASFVTIDVNSSTFDFSACQAILDEINNFKVENNCSEQTASQDAGFVQSRFGALASCTQDKDCSAGEICSVTDVATPSGVCVTAPATCSPQNGNADCGTGEVCAFDPDLGNARCVPDAICPASCSSGTPCNASTGDCQAVTCSPSVTNDCLNKLGGTYSCASGFAGAVCQ